MTTERVCSMLQESLSGSFTCSPAPEGAVRVRTPLMYPDGGMVDVFVVEQEGRFSVSDFGESLGWLRVQSAGGRRSPRQGRLIVDVCQTLGLELERGELSMRVAEGAPVADSVLRVAQGVVRVSDLWFTLRSRVQATALDEVDEWFEERGIARERSVQRPGRSGRNWTLDFETRTQAGTSMVFVLSTGSRSAARRIAEHVVAGCVDLSHLTRDDSRRTLVSLFDDTQDVWRSEDFRLVEQQSDVALWSNPRQFERLLLAA